jgi:hypothetical protein
MSTARYFGLLRRARRRHRDCYQERQADWNRTCRCLLHYDTIGRRDQEQAARTPAPHREAAGGWLWERFTVHYTPKHGSWLNQAEIEIGLFSRQCLGKRRIGDIATLRRQAKAWNRRVNRDQITIKWKFTRKLARLKLNYSFTRS